jgi:hypothetical protein
LTLDTILAELKRERDRLDRAIRALEATAPRRGRRKQTEVVVRPRAAHECRGTSENFRGEAEVVGREEKERLKLGSVPGRPGGQAVLIGSAMGFFGRGRWVGSSPTMARQAGQKTCGSQRTGRIMVCTQYGYMRLARRKVDGHGGRPLFAVLNRFS